MDLYENNFDDRDQGYRFWPSEGRGPDYYMSEDSLDSGVADTVEIDSVTEGDQNVGGMTFNGNNHTLVYNGYFLPDTSGTHEFCIYVDNIVMKTKKTGDLIADLEETFANFCRFQIKHNPKKCVFGVPKGNSLASWSPKKG